ncbi:MAG TPA: hypothetical protein VJ901_10170 [Thermoanaerobaculia bacterium]|nr:hypothetical protein [Thermoanaerobaculia bacterium]
MKKMLPFAFALVIAAAGSAFAQEELNPDAPDVTKIHVMQPNIDGNARTAHLVDETGVEPQMELVDPTPGNEAKFKAASNAVNLTYHGGDVINTAKVVCIFWGPTWASGGSDNSRATTIQAFRNQFGTNSHYGIITQYYDSAYISASNLAGSQPDWFDTTNALPSTGNVTDATVQAEVKRYVSAHGTNYSTVYEVFLPKYVPGTTKLVYSSDGSSTSCGGPGLAYCAYHSSYWNGSNYVKYSIEPYPSCSGCQVSGWTVAQNMEHFMCHETREAVTDPLGNAWYDSTGYEADDKCAWTGLFTENGYGYQPEWSNAINGCKQ